MEPVSMDNKFQRRRQLAFARVVNRVKARTPKPLYQCVRLGWHQLTSSLDHFGLRRLAWRWRLPTEVGHWDLWLSSHGMSDPEDFARRVKPDLPLQGHLRRLLPVSNGPRFRILDIGAGPLTTVGKTCDGRLLDLLCIDPLASVYDSLLNANGITPPVRTKYGEAEQIAQVYGDNFFDLVHAANSLDHAHDPVAAIRAAVRVVRPGGYVFLEHILNEGDRENYGGLHQWNFGVRDNSFAITSKAGEITDITKALAGVAAVRHSIHSVEDLRTGGNLAVLTVEMQKIR
jgi:SAM-dependent methyltransferase